MFGRLDSNSPSSVSEAGGVEVNERCSGSSTNGFEPRLSRRLCGRRSCFHEPASVPLRGGSFETWSAANFSTKSYTITMKQKCLRRSLLPPRASLRKSCRRPRCDTLKPGQSGPRVNQSGSGAATYRSSSIRGKPLSHSLQMRAACHSLDPSFHYVFVCLSESERRFVPAVRTDVLSLKTFTSKSSFLHCVSDVNLGCLHACCMF